MQLRKGAYGIPLMTRLLIVCCAMVVTGFWGISVLVADPSNSWPERPANMEGRSEASDWMTTGAVLVHGGSYSILLKNMQFEPAQGAPAPHKLMVNLIYSNQSPFVIRIEHNSRIQAQVCDQAGACLSKIIVAPRLLMPGEARELTTDLGSVNIMERFSVLFTDRGGNVLGEADMPEHSSPDLDAIN